MCSILFHSFGWRLDVPCPYPVTHLVGGKPFCRECFSYVMAKRLYPGETVKVLGEVAAK